MADQQLEKSIQQRTVRIHTNGGGFGTGFFVASGLILTCAHVVETERSTPIKIYWKEKDQEYTAKVKDFLGESDLATLKLTSEVDLDHPCVTFDCAVPKIDALLYSFGYPNSDMVPNGDSVTCKYEGESYEKSNSTLYKLKEGQFKEGFSGSPLVNLTTGKVCGMISTSINTGMALGGRAVPIGTILSLFSHLEEVNFQSHKKNKFLSTLHLILNLNEDSEIIENDYDMKHPLVTYYCKAVEHITESYKRNKRQEIDVICKEFLKIERENLKLLLEHTTMIDNKIIKDHLDFKKNSASSYKAFQNSIKISNQGMPHDDSQRSEIIKKFEDRRKINQEEACHNLTIEGIKEFEAGNIQIAVNNFKEAINKNIEDEAAHAGLGALLYEQGDIKNAINSLREAKKICESKGMKHRTRELDDFIQSINTENNFFNKIINNFKNFMNFN
jgi:hypothetical protein